MVHSQEFAGSHTPCRLWQVRSEMCSKLGKRRQQKVILQDNARNMEKGVTLHKFQLIVQEGDINATERRIVI